MICRRGTTLCSTSSSKEYFILFIRSIPFFLSVVIHFHFEADQSVKSVYLVGSFNNWDISRDPMVFRKTEGAKNIFDVYLELYSGLYYYKFYLPELGEYSHDPMNPNRVSDSYGGYNSVLEIPVCFLISQGIIL